MLSTVKDISLLSKGTNCAAYKGKLDNNDIVIKEYGLTERNEFTVEEQKTYLQLLGTDIKELNKLLSQFKINIPQIHFMQINPYSQLDIAYKNNPCLTIFESFCGYSFKNMLTTPKYRKDKYIEEIIKCIKSMPEDITLDTNPANFTFLNDQVYFIDLVPPKIKDYQDVPYFITLFPQLEIRQVDRELRRIVRYTTTEGRIRRFLFYVHALEKNLKLDWKIDGSNYLNHQQSLAQTTRVSY